MRKQVGAVGLCKQKTETQTEKLCHFQQYDHNMHIQVLVHTERGDSSMDPTFSPSLEHGSFQLSVLAKVAISSGHSGKICPQSQGKCSPDLFHVLLLSDTSCIGCWSHTQQAHHPCCLAALPQPSKGENPAACDSALFRGTTDCYCRLRLITSLQPRQLEVKH